MWRWVCLVFVLAVLPLLAAWVGSEPTLKQNYPYAVIRRDCAPWDGPAITIYLTKSKVSSREVSAPMLRLSLWRNLPRPLNKPIALSTGEQVGVASRCTSLTNCEAAVSATLTLTTYSEGHGATGTYELKFKTGDVERGSFQADWQDFTQMCG